MSEINLSNLGSQFKIEKKVDEKNPDYEFYTTDDGKQIAVYTGPLKNSKGVEVIPQAYIKDSFSAFESVDFNEVKFSIEKFHNNDSLPERKAEDLISRNKVDNYEYFESKSGEDFAFYRPRTGEDGVSYKGGAFKKDINGNWQNIDYEDFKTKVENFYRLDISSEPEVIIDKAQEGNDLDNKILNTKDQKASIPEDDLFTEMFDDAEVVDTSKSKQDEKLISKKINRDGATDFYELTDGSKLSYNFEGGYGYKQEKGSREWTRLASVDLEKFKSEIDNYREPTYTEDISSTKSNSNVTSGDNKSPNLPTGNEKNVLFWFTAGYCQPCRQMKDNGTKGALENKYNVITVDVTEQPELVTLFRVGRVPTFVAVGDSDEVGRSTGLTNLESLEVLANSAGAMKP